MKTARLIWLVVALGLCTPSFAAQRGIYVPLKRVIGPPRALLRRNGTLPLHGAVREGYFYARLALGTPPREYEAIIDTGSTITYVPCAGCKHCGKHTSRAFDPAASSTAQVLPCGHARCRCGSPRCGCDGEGRCTYSRGYAEQSASSGLLVLDKVALPDGGPPADLAFGCAMAESGEIYRQAADGILGLGNTPNALHSQLAAAGAVERVFGLCFGFPSGGALLLGNALPAGAAAALAWTPLLPAASPYYVVSLDAVTIAGAPLAVDPTEYAVGYGAVVDSGTTFTYLPSRAFRAFSAAITAAAARAGLARAPGPDPDYPDLCWRGAPPAFRLEGVFPAAALRFGNGAELALPPHRYLFAAGAAGEYCLGVFDNGDAGTLIGGIAGRNALVVYDLERGRVGFGDADCPALGAAAASKAGATLPFALPAAQPPPSPPLLPAKPAAAPAPSDSGSQKRSPAPQPKASPSPAGTGASVPAAAAAPAPAAGAVEAAGAAAADPSSVETQADAPAAPASNATTSGSNSSSSSSSSSKEDGAETAAASAIALPLLPTVVSAEKAASLYGGPNKAPGPKGNAHVQIGAGVAAAAAAVALVALVAAALAAASGRIPPVSQLVLLATGRARFERLPSEGGGGGGDVEAELTPLAGARAGGGGGSGGSSSSDSSGQQQQPPPPPRALL